MTLRLPELPLVLLIGPSGPGKSTFARKHFKPAEVVAWDICRGMVSDDENDQSVTPQAFGLLHFILRRRLALGRFTPAVRCARATNGERAGGSAAVESR